MSSATFFTFSPFSRGEIIGENRRLFCLCDAKTGEHCICGGQLGAVVQMGVNICCGRNIAVTKTFLNLLHGNTVCEHQTGREVPDIVKTDAPQTVCFQKLRKLLRHIMGLDEITDLIDADITCILLVVRFPAEPSVVVLLHFDGKQPFLDERNQRKGSHTGLGFGGIRCLENVLIVEVHRRNGVPDDNGVVLKINGIPFKTDGFAAAQTVESTEQNRQLQLVPLETSKSLFTSSASKKLPTK